MPESFEDLLKRKLGERESAEESLSQFEREQAGTLPDALKGAAINSAALHSAYADRGWEEKREKVVLGNLEQEGFKVIHANMSMGEDAFGISPDRRTYCVADGMGGSVCAGPLAKFLSTELSKNNDSWQQAFTKEGLESLVAAFLEQWIRENDEQDLNDINGHSTLSICRIQDDGSVRILVLGDSPVYIQQKNGEQTSFGNKGINNAETGVALGITKGILDFEFDQDNAIHNVSEAESVVIASDWFSDNYESVTKEYNEKWIADVEQKYPTVKTTGEIPIPNGFLILNQYRRRCNLRSRYLPFDPMRFASVSNEDQIQTEMASKYTTKPDDITIAMINVNKIL